MNKIKNGKIYKKILALAVLPFILSSCSQKSDCEIKGDHAHLYVNSDSNTKTYIYSEELHYGNYHWQNDYIPLNNDDKNFFKIKDVSANRPLIQVKEAVFFGKDYWDYLFNTMKNCHDYIKFYYEYTRDEYVSMTDEDGNECGYWQTNTYSGWTTNPRDSDNTGRVRLFHHRFYGYRFYESNGEYIKKMSPLVDDIRDIIDDYPFFSDDCIEIVYKDFNFKRHELLFLSPSDFTYYKGPDLDNPELYSKGK